MKTGAAVVGMLAAAGLGSAATGWAVSSHDAAQNGRRHAAVQAPMLPGRPPSGFPLGDIAGARVPDALVSMPNPLGEGPQVVHNGRQLFEQMNCAYCHGWHAGGQMGPNLTDVYWRYGGAPAQIYNSIAEGRPQGMPAWGRSLPPELIWELTAYVHSLGGGVPAAQAVAARHGDYQGTVDIQPQQNADEGVKAIEGQ